MEGCDTRRCPQCGFESADEKRFCGNCGASLLGVPAVPRDHIPDAPPTLERYPRPRWMRREMFRYLAERSVIAVILLLIGGAAVLVNLERCHVEEGCIRTPTGCVPDYEEVCEPKLDLKIIGTLLIGAGVIFLARTLVRAYWG